MPPGYYTLTVPALLRQDRHSLSALRRAELDKFGAACRSRPELRGMVQTLFDVHACRAARRNRRPTRSLAALLAQHGFDRVQHEQIRADLQEGRIGLAQNRLPASTVIEDVRPRTTSSDASTREPDRGLARSWARRRCRAGEVAVVTLAAGAGSRWTQGAGVVKALHPVLQLAGRHRTFIEIHLAKSRRVVARGRAPPSRTSSPPAT